MRSNQNFPDERHGRSGPERPFAATAGERPGHPGMHPGERRPPGMGDRRSDMYPGERRPEVYPSDRGRRPQEMMQRDGRPMNRDQRGPHSSRGGGPPGPFPNRPNGPPPPNINREREMMRGSDRGQQQGNWHHGNDGDRFDRNGHRGERHSERMGGRGGSHPDARRAHDDRRSRR